MIKADLFTKDELIELQADLLVALGRQGFDIEEIRLIGVKGHGYHATVFSVMIDDNHHVLKVYREAQAFEREVKHLYQVIPKDRFLFVWRAEENRFDYNIVIVEVPDGQELRPKTLTTQSSERLTEQLIALHSLRSRRRVSAKSLKLRIEEMRPLALEHAKEFADYITPEEVAADIEEVKQYLRDNREKFRVRKSRTHGDLWWSNIIVAEEAVYMIDWERLRFADYLEDLAKMRVLFHFVRRTDPTTFFGRKGVSQDKVDGFMSPILRTYRHSFSDPMLLGRYGFYCFLYGLTFFGNYVYADKKGTPEAINMYLEGRAQFRKYADRHSTN